MKYSTTVDLEPNNTIRGSVASSLQRPSAPNKQSSTLLTVSDNWDNDGEKEGRRSLPVDAVPIAFDGEDGVAYVRKLVTHISEREWDKEPWLSTSPAPRYQYTQPHPIPHPIPHTGMVLGGRGQPQLTLKPQAPDIPNPISLSAPLNVPLPASLLFAHQLTSHHSDHRRQGPAATHTPAPQTIVPKETTPPS